MPGFEGMLVRLRPVAEADHALFPHWISFSEAGALAGAGGSDSMATDSWTTELTSPNSHYVLIETHHGEKVGTVSWREKAHPHSFEMGGLVGATDLWDSGYGMEAALLVLDYLFEQANAHRVQLVAGLYNARTVAFMVQDGVTVEGVLRDYLYLDGSYHDALIGSILRDEYYAPYQGYTPVTRLLTADACARARRMVAARLHSQGPGRLTRLLRRD